MNAPLHRALVLTAWVAGFFSVLVCAMMIYGHVTASINDPWKSPQLLALKDKLAAEPKNEQVQMQIRELDLKYRQLFRHRLELDKTGARLLVAGIIAMILAAGKAAALKAKSPLPQPKSDGGEQALKQAGRARWSVAGVALAVAVLLVAVRLANSSVLPTAEAGAPMAGMDSSAQASPAEVPPSLVEFQTNWPRFRGWDGSGVTADTNFGTNIIWRAAVSAPGHGSPIIWGDRVFLSGGTAAKREVFCYAATNGALLWQKSIENVPGSPAKVLEVPEDTTYAAPTMATDGRRVYAIFANGDLAALNFDGSLAWTKYVGPFKNDYGYATSLAVWGTNLIIQLDQGSSEPGGSKLISLQGATGRILWERSRLVPASWATPIVGDAAGKIQIITLANPWVIGYAAADGVELWRAQLLENEVVPSPVMADGLVVLLSPGSKLFGLRPDGAGDVTKTCVAWSTDENPPDITSPVFRGGCVFTVTSIGIVTCYNASNGKKVWEKNLDKPVQASPGIVGNRLIVLGQEGLLVTLSATAEFHEFARCQLPDQFRASPSFARGEIFLRGATNLFCLGPAKQP